MTLRELFDAEIDWGYDWWDKTTVDDFMEGSWPNVVDFIDELKEKGFKLNLDTKIDK